MVDVVGGFFGAIIGIFLWVFKFLMGVFPLLVLAGVALAFIGIILLMYFSIKKKFEKIDLFTPRQVTYISTIESSLALKNPLMKDLWISGDGRTPQIKLGDVIGFNAEPSKIKTLNPIGNLSPPQ